MPRNPSNSKINQFMTMTNCPDRKFVIDHLKKHNNNVQQAVNSYFDQNLAANFGPSPDVLEKVFEEYKGKNPHFIYSKL